MYLRIVQKESLPRYGLNILPRAFGENEKTVFLSKKDFFLHEVYPNGKVKDNFVGAAQGTLFNNTMGHTVNNFCSAKNSTHAYH